MRSSSKRQAGFVTMLAALVLSRPAGSSTLYPIQLQAITEVSFQLSVDASVSASESPIRAHVEARLREAGLQVRPIAYPKVEVTVSTATYSRCSDTVALSITVRLRDDVSLRRIPSVNLANHPAVIWERADLELVPSTEVQQVIKHSVDEIIDSLIDERGSVERMLATERGKGDGARK